MAGWSLYLDSGSRPVYHYSWLGHEHYVISGGEPLLPGRHSLVVDFVYEGGMGGGGDAVLSVDDVPVGTVHKNHTVPVIFSISGETFDVGMDCGVPVGDYPMIYRFTGSIHGVTLERLTEPPAQIRALIEDAEFRASLAVQ